MIGKNWKVYYISFIASVAATRCYLRAQTIANILIDFEENLLLFIFKFNKNLSDINKFLLVNIIYTSFATYPQKRISDAQLPTFVRYLFNLLCEFILKSSYIYFYRHYAKCERSATRPVSQAYCSFNHATSIVLLFLLFPFHFHYGGRKKCSTIIRAVKYDTFPPRTLVFQF